MDLKRRATRGAAWATLEVWGNEALQFVLFAVLARLLGPGVYGVLGLALILVLVGQTVLVLGGWIEALIRRPGLEPLHLDSVFWFVLGLGLGLAWLAWLGAPLMAWAFAVPELAEIVPWLALHLPLSSLNIVPLALLQRELRLAPLALRSTLGVAVAGAVGVTMALAGWGVWSLVAYQLTQPLVAILVFWSVERWRPRLRFSLRHWREIAGFSLNVIGERLLLLGENLLPRILLGWALGPTAVGHWALARKLFDLSAELVQRPLLRVALPAFSGAQAEPTRVGQMLALALDMAAAAAVPGYLVMLVLAPELVVTLFGAAWAPTAPALQILAAVGLVTPAQQILGALTWSYGRADWSLGVAAAGSVVLAIAMAALSPWGLVGIALAFGLRAVVVLPARLALAGRLLGTRPLSLLRGNLPIAAAGLAMLPVLLAARAALAGQLGPLASLASLLAIAGITYLAAMLALARPLLARAVALVRHARGDGSAGP
jgi:PST family polysaccharide transporter